VEEEGRNEKKLNQQSGWGGREEGREKLPFKNQKIFPSSP